MKHFWTAGNSGKFCDEPQALHHPRSGKITFQCGIASQKHTANYWLKRLRKAYLEGSEHETVLLPWNKFYTILSPTRDCYMSETVCFMFSRCHVPRHCLFQFTIFFNQGDVNFIFHIFPTFQTICPICFDKNWNQLTTFVLPPRLDSKFKIPPKNSGTVKTNQDQQPHPQSVETFSGKLRLCIANRICII